MLVFWEILRTQYLNHSFPNIHDSFFSKIVKGLKPFTISAKKLYLEFYPDHGVDDWQGSKQASVKYFFNTFVQAL